MAKKITVLELKGTRYEMGRRHGEARAEGIGVVCDALLGEISRAVYCATTEEQLISYACHHMAVTAAMSSGRALRIRYAALGIVVAVTLSQPTQRRPGRRRPDLRRSDRDLRASGP